MRVLLLDEEKITKLTLPSEVDGVFTMKYRPVDSKVIKEFNIEAINEKWLLKSNDIFNVVINGQINQEVALSDYMHFQIFLIGRDTYLDFYCLPTIEKNSYQVSVSTNQVLIGDTKDCSIILNNINGIGNLVSITSNNGSSYITSDSSNGIRAYLNDRFINESMILKTGDVIFVAGLKLIWMQRFIQICGPAGIVNINPMFLQNMPNDPNYNNEDYEKVSDEEQGIELYQPDDYFFHRPNLKEYVTLEEVKIDPPPSKETKGNDNFLATFGASFTMIASSFVSAINLFNNIANNGNVITIVTSAIMFISMLVGSLLIPRLVAHLQKKKEKKREQYRIEKYTQYLKECYEKIKGIIAKQTQILRNTNLNVKGCLNLINSNNLWNREIKDEDFLIVRLGIGNVPAEIKINAPEEHFSLDEDSLMSLVYEVVNSTRILEDVPVTFNFIKNRVSAIITNVNYGESFVDSVIIQLATLQSSQDLKMVFFINNDEDDYDWEYTKYLPHTFSDNKSTRYFADSYDEMKILSTELENILKEREESSKSSEENNDIVEDSKAYKKFDSYYIIFTNDVLLAKSLPIIEKIMSSSENLGFSLVFINKSMNKLPKRCNSFIALSNESGCVLDKDINSQLIFAPEYIKDADFRMIASQLMNIPVLDGDVQSSLPTSLSFLEAYNVTKIEQLNITNRWKTNDPTMSLGVTIGVHANGEPFILDLHEKAHGPHGLIAGSTGSGKSEFIMTYILSLAVNFHPDEVQFVLIDYKGGGLAGAFENREKNFAIPHLAGTITNLDTASMNRSLVSINSELKRREQMLMDARDATGESTLDIYKYQKYYREGIVKQPMSHLFIISDEFAELKSQQPEFMNELISTARIGRSLGVHLLLATQKPSGVVNDQIWSNSRFRICLKVQTTGDSNEMLKRPDAASIKDVGRFYLQVGYDEYFDIGQSGWAGAKYVPSDRSVKKVDDSICVINNVGVVTKSITDLLKKETSADLGDQLTNIVKMLCAWSKKENYVPKKLWLDPIPEEVYIGNLAKKYNFIPHPYKINPIIGEYDNPKKQMQGLLNLNLNNGNTYIYGKNGSGKEDLISTIIYSTCATHSPKEVNFYIVDMGAGTLRSYIKYPHVGDVCTIDDGDKIIDLMAMMEREITRRKELTVEFGGNFETYNEMNANEKLPLVCVIINNLDIFTENLSKIAELIIPLYRDGAKYGVTFIVSCIGINTLRAKTREYFANHISLRVANIDDFFSIFDNYPRHLEPADFKGRGLVEIGKDVLEFQTALIYSKNEVNTIIRTTGDKLAQTYKDFKIAQIPSIPKVVNVESLLAEVTSLNKIPLGYDTQTKEKYYYNFANTKVNLIAANDFDDNLGFLNALVMEFRMLENYNYDIKIIDFSGYFDILTIGLTCYQSNFNDTFGRLIEESENLTKETVYIITGIGKLKANVDPNNMPFVNDFFKGTLKKDKIHFVFIDTYEELNVLKIEDWYMTVVNQNFGIWLGKDVGSQTIINFNNLTSDDRLVNNPEFSFVSDNGKKRLIKHITYKIDDNGDEL